MKFLLKTHMLSYLNHIKTFQFTCILQYSLIEDVLLPN